MSLDLEEEPLGLENDSKTLNRELRGSRWLHGGFRHEDLVPFAEDTAAVHNGTHIKIIYLPTGEHSALLTLHPDRGEGSGAPM